MTYSYDVLFWDRKLQSQKIIRVKAKSKLKAEQKFKEKYPDKDFICVLM